jgi:hypothetical protein
MRKLLILLSFLSVGCSPLKNASLEESEEFYKNHIEFRITQQIIREITSKNLVSKNWAEICSKTSKCLKKATYLHYDYHLDQHKCLLAENDKEVSCK